MDIAELLTLFAAQSVPQLIIGLTLWPVFPNLIASGFQVVGKKGLEALRAWLEENRSALQTAWAQVFKEAVETSYKNWHREWKGKSRSLRLSGKRAEAEGILREAKHTRKYLKDHANVIFADWKIDPRYISNLVSSAEQLASGEYSLGVELRKQLMDELRPYVPNCPEDLWKALEDHLLPSMGRGLARQLQDPQVQTGYLAGMHSLILELLHQLIDQGLTISQEDERKLLDSLLEGLGNRVELLLATEEAEITRLIAASSDWQDRMESSLQELQCQLAQQRETLDQVDEKMDAALQLLGLQLEHLGFRSSDYCLSSSPPNREPCPWPMSPWDPWPAWQDFTDMVVRSKAVDRILSGLGDNQVLLVTGEYAVGKSTAAKYIGYEFVRSDQPWAVYFLERPVGTDTDPYAKFDPMNLIDLLTLPKYRQMPLLLIFEDVHEAPEDVLDLYRLLDQYSLPPNIKLLLVGNTSLFNASGAGRQLQEHARAVGREIEVWMGREDIVEATRCCLRYKSGNPTADFSEEDYADSFDKLVKFCRRRWILLRVFLQTRQYRDSTDFLWSAHWYPTYADYETLLDELYQANFGELPHAQQEALWTIAALASLGIWTRHEFFEKRDLLSEVTALKQRGLLLVSRDGKAYSVGHPSLAQLYIESAFRDRLQRQRVVESRLRDYLFSEPANYSRVLSMPILNDEAAVLRGALGGETRDEAIQHLDALLASEEDVAAEVQALHRLFRADRRLARRLVGKQAEQIKRKLRRSLAEMDYSKLANVVRCLRIIYRRRARELIDQVIESGAVAQRLAQLEDVGQIGRCLRQLYLAYPSLAREISRELEKTGLYLSLPMLLKDASFEQIVSCLGGIASLDYQYARHLLESLEDQVFADAVASGLPVRVAKSLQFLTLIHPAYVSALVSRWLSDDSSASTVFALRDRLMDLEYSAVELCSVVAEFAKADSSLGAWLAAHVCDEEILVSDWIESGKRLDVLGKIVGRLSQANQTQAALLLEKLSHTDIQGAFSRSFDYPLSIGWGLINLYHVSPSIARVGREEVLRDHDRLTTSLRAWLSQADFEGLALFLQGVALTDPPRARKPSQLSSEDPLSRLWTDLGDEFVLALDNAIAGGQLEKVGKFLSQMARYGVLRHCCSRVVSRLRHELAGAIEEKRSSLDAILILLQGVAKVNILDARRAIAPKRERLLRRFRNRMRSEEVDLAELGNYLLVVSAIDADLASASLQIIDWKVVLEESEAEGNVGRFVPFLSGLASAGFRPDRQKPDTFAKFVELIESDLLIEPELSKIAEVLRSLTIIDQASARRIVDEIMDIEDLIERLELEPRVARISAGLHALTQTGTAKAGMVVQALDLKTLASKIYRTGRIVHVTELIWRLWEAMPEPSQEGHEIPAKLLLTDHLLDYSRLATQVKRESDAGCLAALFWNLVSLAPSSAENLLCELTAEQISRRICGIKDIASHTNITGVDRPEMVRRLGSRKGPAKVSSLLLATRQVDSNWAKSLLDELQLLYQRLGGTLAIHFERDLFTDLAEFAEIDQLAWLAREADKAGAEAARTLVKQIEDRYVRLPRDQIEEDLSDIAWALWMLSQSPRLAPIAESLAGELVDRFGKENLYTRALTSERVIDIASLIGGFGLASGCFDSGFWDEWHEKVWLRAAEDRHFEWLARAVALAGPEKAADWGVSVDSEWSEADVWDLCWSRFGFWRIAEEQ